MIKIQEKDFNIEEEINLIKSKHSSVGAISTFIGFVRDNNNNEKVNYLTLEVYRDMAFKYLDDICKKAKKKWELIDCLIVHRHGKLLINEKIVLVAVFSIHRKSSFEACNYIMDCLKKEAPFWKKEYYEEGFKWLKNTK